MKKLIFIVPILILLNCGEQNAQKNNDESTSNNTKFVWDFSTPKKIIYSYSITSKAESRTGKDEKGDISLVTGIGNLNVKINEKKSADITFTDIKMSMYIFDSDKNPTDTISTTEQPSGIQKMNNDGSFKDQNTNFILDLIFLLPSYDLDIGESDKIPMKMPLNVSGTFLMVKGFNTIEFIGFETIENINCAVLKSRIDISDMVIPEELEGEYKSTTTGEATYYFDLEHKYLVGADIHIIIEDIRDTEGVEKNSFGMYMEMKSDNVYKIRLEKIEE